LKWDHNSILYTQHSSWDIAINLDKEKEAGALLKIIDAKEKYGFVLKDNEIQPINDLAQHKFATGMFDDVSKANTKSYLQEIFEICGFEHQGEPYLMDTHVEKGYQWDLPKDKKIIGLNTGCGGRWTTRLWTIDKWVELVALLKTQHPDAHILLLGGEAEDARNKEIKARSGAHYLGYFSLFEFINLVNHCHLVVTQVTMGMHITLALGKKIVLMNNIFNPNEFDLFGKGEIVMPNKACKCFYRGSCLDGTSCMEELPAAKIAEAVKSHF
jgi:heptosyltransferase-2